MQTHRSQVVVHSFLRRSLGRLEASAAVHDRAASPRELAVTRRRLRTFTVGSNGNGYKLTMSP